MGEPVLSDNGMRAGSEKSLRRTSPVELNSGLLKQINRPLPDFWWRIWVREADG
jgi:hypothetical protein